MGGEEAREVEREGRRRGTAKYNPLPTVLPPLIFLLSPLSPLTPLYSPLKGSLPASTPPHPPASHLPCTPVVPLFMGLNSLFPFLFYISMSPCVFWLIFQYHPQPPSNLRSKIVFWISQERQISPNLRQGSQGHIKVQSVIPHYPLFKVLHEIIECEAVVRYPHAWYLYVKVSWA